MLLALVLALQSLVPAVAFSPHASGMPKVVAATTCSSKVRYIGGPAPVPASNTPHGLVSKLLVHVSASGAFVKASVLKPSGDATFDEAVLVAARKGTWSPAVIDCKPVAATYVFLAETGP